jgi:hypothetical protein
MHHTYKTLLSDTIDKDLEMHPIVITGNDVKVAG